MRFSEYLSSKAAALCFLGAGAVLFAAAMLFVRVPPGMLLLFGGLFCGLVVAWTAVGYARERGRVKKLEALLDGLEEKYLLAELLPPPVSGVERRYFEVMKTVCASAFSAAQQARADKAEYCEYVERWIHEIKTPLTACSLMLANGGEISRMKKELCKANNLVESVLYCARLRTQGTDAFIRRFWVQQVLQEAVRSQMELLLASGISAEVMGDFETVGDAQALSFMIKQLLVNCAKYCPRCRVALRAQNGSVTVEDNGPGVPAHELPRLTERGFTGSNSKPGGTGMGLYLVREMCKKQGIGFLIESELGSFTRFVFTLPQAGG